MKFPITRESLQAFNYATSQQELREEEIQRRITLCVDELCREFKKNMPNNSKDKKFVWRNLNTIQHIQVHALQNTNGGALNLTSLDCLTQFIDKLKEIFIGCDIITDPLKTYLIIDWA